MTKALWGILAVIAVLALANDRWQLVALCALVALWGWQQGGSSAPVVDRSGLTAKLRELQAMIQEVQDGQLQQSLTLQAQAIDQALGQTQVRVAILGLKGVGKTSVIRAIVGYSTTDRDASYTPNSFPFQHKQKKITLIDSDGVQLDRAIVTTVELCVLVVAGDMSATEYAFLRDLLEAGQRVLVAINKTDLLLPTDVSAIQQHIVQLTGLDPKDVIPIAAHPRPITVRQYSQDKNALVQAWQEPVPPTITPLKQRIEQVIDQEWENLWQKKVAQQLAHLQTQTETVIKKQRRLLAAALIVRQQKLVALGLFASPLPTLDLATSLVLNAQLLMEIAQIYQRQLNFDHARQIAQHMALQLVQVGGIEVITTTVSSFLKTNFFTYTIGGVVQGLSASYFTHLCAQSFLDYLEAQPLQARDTQPSPIPTEIKLLPYNLQGWLNSQLSSWLQEIVPQITSTYPRHGLTGEK